MRLAAEKIRHLQEKSLPLTKSRCRVNSRIFYWVSAVPLQGKVLEMGICG